jgi:oligopeptide transport system substrate-binding protein
MLPAYSFVPPGIGNYREPAYLDFKTMSPIDREAKAMALLQEMGFGPGGKPLKIEIRYNMTDNNKNTAVAIADQWKQFGIETTFISTDAKTHFAYLSEGGDYEIARVGWIGDYSDPQNFLFLGLSDNALNYAKYNNPEFDSLVRKAEEETDLKKRADILYQAERVWMRDEPVIPLLYYSTKNLVSPKLKGFVPNLRGAFPSRFYQITP